MSTKSGQPQTASEDNTARVWSAEGMGAPVVLRGHEGVVNSASFSPDGKRVVTASEDNTARVWSAEGTGAPVVLRGHKGFVESASFSPDGKRVVIASDDQTVRVWTVDIQDLQKLLRAVNSDCLPPDTRQSSLDETAAEAQEHYEDCERSYGRPPFFTAAGAH